MTVVGILGIGVYLPDEIRTNDWWPRDIVDGWIAARATATEPVSSPLSPGASKVAAAMAAHSGDPFQGTRTRRVLPADQITLDMEQRAARAAIESAGIDPMTIDLVLCHSAVPEAQLTNAACPLHHRLGLRPSALAVEVDAGGFSFLAQLAIAEAMIASGRIHNALLVQSSTASRLTVPEHPLSPLFGDGATAAIVGRVAPGHGVLAISQRTLGASPNTLIASPPGHAWYHEGRSVLHLPKPTEMNELLLNTADRAHDVITEALARADVRGDEVDFFGSHQGSVWLRAIAQQHAGLVRARWIDTFAETGHLFAASIPLDLHRAEETGLLSPDDLVVLFAGGTGMTYGAIVMRWGGHL